MGHAGYGPGPTNLNWRGGGGWVGWVNPILELLVTMTSSPPLTLVAHFAFLDDPRVERTRLHPYSLPT